MKLSEIQEWFSLFANVAVFAGIVFLVVEIRQTNELMAVEERFNRLSALTGLQETLLENANLPAILAKLASGQELELEEQIAFNAYLNMNTRSREWTFRELPYEELPISFWRRLYSSPWTEEHFHEFKSDWDPEFVEFIERDILPSD